MHDIPVILITYNRPWHTRQVLLTLKKYDICNLFIFSDGPRTSEDADKVSETRALFKKIDWTTPRIRCHTKNIGLARSVTGAIDEVLNEYDRFIMLEDDSIPLPGFFDYFKTCLDKYQDNEKVFGICGYTEPIPFHFRLTYPYDIYFHPRIGSSGGWATWKRAWQYYDSDIYRLCKKVISQKIDIIQGGVDIRDQVKRVLEKKLDAWTLNWVLSTYLQNGYYIYPTVSQLMNIGWDGSGANCCKKLIQKSEVWIPKRYPDGIVFSEAMIDILNNRFFNPKCTENYQPPTRLPQVELDYSRINSIENRKLKVAHLSVKDSGGAGKAAYRIHTGMREMGVDSSLYVLNKKTDDSSVKLITASYDGELNPQWQKEVDRFNVLLNDYPNRAGDIEFFSDTQSQIDISAVSEIKEADIIHLHWTPGMVDFEMMERHFKNKPLVWTLHDMNAFTGGCHYTGRCDNYKKSCGNCPQLGSHDPEDITRQIWKQKKRIYPSLNLNIVTPSKWLQQCASESVLFKNKQIQTIANGISMDLYNNYKKDQIRQKLGVSQSAKVILFAANSVLCERKGLPYLIESLKRLPDITRSQEIVLLLMGKQRVKMDFDVPYPVFSLGSLSEEKQLVLAYNTADVFVLPSLEDNLPNTVVESLACGVPVVAFETGGIPDMIEHKLNGYLAKPCDVQDMAEGIRWVLDDAEKTGMNISNNCRKKALWEYNVYSQAARYAAYYKKILNDKQTVHEEVSSNQDGITLFTIPKPFDGHISVIQQNAIQSWTKLSPRPEIILFGDEKGIAEAAQKLGVKHIPHIKCNEHGTPMLDDVFAQVQKVAKNNTLVYANTDIIFTDNLVSSIDQVKATFEKYLIVGQRWDMEMSERIHFSDSRWQQKLLSQVETRGKLHSVSGIDYFVFPKKLHHTMPPFLVGRPTWDNWLVYESFLKYPVVDATESITCIHQNHHYNHVQGGKMTAWQGPEAKHNHKLAGRKVLMGSGYIYSSTHKLSKSGISEKLPQDYPKQIDDYYDRLIERDWDVKAWSHRPFFKSVTTINRIKNPDISVIIVSWRKNPALMETVKILQKQKEVNVELIFVDNGANEGEFDDMLPYINTLIKLNSNSGAYISRNIAALYANAPILLFLDDNCVPSGDVLSAHLKMYQRYRIISVCGAVLPQNQNATLTHSHFYFGPRPFPNFACHEKNFSVKAEAFYKAGGWEDKVALGFGGRDLTYRLIEQYNDPRLSIYSPVPAVFHLDGSNQDIVHSQHRLKTEAYNYFKQTKPEIFKLEEIYKPFDHTEEALIFTTDQSQPAAQQQGPLVTVEMVTYNSEKTIKQAIDSVLTQTYDNFELLIIDDGSRDQTQSIIKGYQDKRIKYIRKEHKNRWSGTNVALKQAAGKYILAVDSDDFISETYIEKLVTYAEKNPESDYYYPACFTLVDEHNRPAGVTWDYHDFSDNTILPAVLFENASGPIPYPGSLRRLDLYKTTGSFTEIENCGDFDFLCRNALKVRFKRIDTHPEYFYRRSATSLSNRLEIKQVNISRILNEMVSLYPPEVLCPKIKNESNQRDKQQKYYEFLVSTFDRHAQNNKDRFGHYYQKYADDYREKLSGLLVTNSGTQNHLVNDSGLSEHRDWKELFNMGLQYLKLESPAKALEIFDRIYGSGMRLPNVQYARAVALMQLNRIDDAVRACQSELQISPSNDGAAKLLEELSGINYAKL